MFLRDKLCQKKTLFICLLSFCSLLCGLFLCSSECSAITLPTDHFKVSYKPTSDSAIQWSSSLYYGSSSNLQAYSSDGFQIYWYAVTASGNTASIHFETNLVAKQIWYPPYSDHWMFYFTEGNISVRACNVGSIVNNSVSTVVTPWWSDSNGFKTLTIYGDVTISGLVDGQSYSIMCYVGSTEPIYNRLTSEEFYSQPHIYFEQNPTQINFSNNVDNSLLQTQIQQNSTIIQQNINTYNMQQEEMQNIRNSVEEGNQSEQDRWEADHQEQDDKEDELEDQSDDLSLSASVTPNPFIDFFLNDPFSSSAQCVVVWRLPSLFNASSWTICSPYPASFRFLLSYGNSLVIIGLLIRLYYKKLKGGVDG